jgi:ribosomal protein S18 acetylase RimI-like enzyme
VRLRQLHADDRPALAALLRATETFTPDEVEVALELIDLELDDPGGGHGYRFVVAEVEGAVAGYACYGRTPMTDNVWDLYWLAVAPEGGSRGTGTGLLAAVEAAAAAEGARMIVVETASQASYGPARAFYERQGYAAVARVPDFYAPGDDKLIYVRRFAAGGSGAAS